MIKDNMPDAVKVWKNGRLYCRDYNDTREPIHSRDAPIERYLRAEPVEKLLKQARDVLHRLRNDASTQDHVNANKTITAIDKFLGERK